MTLRNEDKDWIHAEIRSAVDALKPHGWRKAVVILRELGPLAASIAVVITLLGITLGAVYQSVAHVKEETEFRTNAKDRLDRLDTDVVSLRALISSSQPLKSQNQNAAKELLAQARQKLVPPIPQPAVEQAGISFIDAAETEPNAWGIALDFMNYRSSLNVYTRSVNTIESPGGPVNFNLGPLVDGKPVPKGSFNPAAVALKDAARFETIGKNLNEQLQFGIGQLVLTGGAVSLDDKYVRHVIFDRVEVHYSGKTLKLDDAVFVNCTFVFENTLPGRRFGQALLASSPVKFENAG